MPSRLYSRLAVSLFALSGIVFALNQSDETRGLKPREYAQQLPQKVAKSRPPSTHHKRRTAPDYVPTVDDNSPMSEGIDVGITFWRLRKARKADDPTLSETTRIVKRVRGKEVEGTTKTIPERVVSETAWSDGDMFRLGIESPFECYIYILNQERYADGTLSEPYLVFPSQGDMSRRAKAAPGKLVYVPGEPDYFEISSLGVNGREKVAEVFVVLLSPLRLDALTPLAEGVANSKVDSNLLQRLQREWDARAWKFENLSTPGMSITKVEKHAGSNGAQVLTDDDPEPQTIYHIARKKGDALLITVPVKTKK
jgi:hypothetical protein